MSPQARRETVRAMRAKTPISERRAGSLIGRSRTVLRYAACSDARNIGVRARIIALAATRRRFGYRRIHVMLRREGARCLGLSASGRAAADRSGQADAKHVHRELQRQVPR